MHRASLEKFHRYRRTSMRMRGSLWPVKWLYRIPPRHAPTRSAHSSEARPLHSALRRRLDVDATVDTRSISALDQISRRSTRTVLSRNCRRTDDGRTGKGVKNQVVGATKEAAGKLRDAVADITGDTSEQIKGKAQVVEGKVQKRSAAPRRTAGRQGRRRNAESPLSHRLPEFMSRPGTYMRFRGGVVWYLATAGSRPRRHTRPPPPRPARRPRCPAACR